MDLQEALEQISAFDLVPYLETLGPLSTDALNKAADRASTLDALEFIVLRQFENGPVAMLMIKLQARVDALPQFSPENMAYWQDLRASFGYAGDTPIFDLTQYFARFEYPSNQLVEFAARQPGFDARFASLEPWQKLKYCRAEQISTYFDASFPLEIRMSALLRTDNLDQLLGPYLNTSASKIERYLYYKQTDALSMSLPPEIVAQIVDMVRRDRDDVFIVPKFDILSRLALKPRLERRAILHALEHLDTEMVDLLQMILQKNGSGDLQWAILELCKMPQAFYHTPLADLTQFFAPYLTRQHFEALIAADSVDLATVVRSQLRAGFTLTSPQIQLFAAKFALPNLEYGRVPVNLLSFSQRNLLLDTILGAKTKLGMLAILHLFDGSGLADEQEQVEWQMRVAQNVGRKEMQQVLLKSQWRGVWQNLRPLVLRLMNAFPDIALALWAAAAPNSRQVDDLDPYLSSNSFAHLMTLDLGDDLERVVDYIRVERPHFVGNLSAVSPRFSDAAARAWLRILAPEKRHTLLSRSTFKILWRAVPNEQRVEFLVSYFNYWLQHAGEDLLDDLQFATDRMSPRIRQQFLERVSSSIDYYMDQVTIPTAMED